MVKIREDMTGWIMSEHGIPESRWIVIEQTEDYITPRGIHEARWACKCKCGNPQTFLVLQGHLRHGDSLSCGCLTTEKIQEKLIKHGKCETKLYPIWLEMKQRCKNPRNKKYKDYGARGISVCKEWDDSFVVFYDWAMQNGYDECADSHSCTIDRINTNGNYCPENCRWVNNIVQGRNQRIRSDNTSGVKGVNWDNTNQKWIARITVNKVRIHLGAFSNKQDAVQARKDAEKKFWGDKNDL